jgi:hypothetical protein
VSAQIISALRSRADKLDAEVAERARQQSVENDPVAEAAMFLSSQFRLLADEAEGYSS